MPRQELTRPSFTRKRGVGINQESSWHGRNFASNTVLYSQVFREARCLVLMVTKQRRLIGRPDFLCPILLIPYKPPSHHLGMRPPLPYSSGCSKVAQTSPTYKATN